MRVVGLGGAALVGHPCDPDLASLIQIWLPLHDIRIVLPVLLLRLESSRWQAFSASIARFGALCQIFPRPLRRIRQIARNFLL